jgi:hypothetical protein
MKSRTCFHFRPQIHVLTMCRFHFDQLPLDVEQEFDEHCLHVDDPAMFSEVTMLLKFD